MLWVGGGWVAIKVTTQQEPFNIVVYKQSSQLECHLKSIASQIQLNHLPFNNKFNTFNTDNIFDHGLI